MTIKLIVGLGNPGNEYNHTRHNAGLDLLMEIADKYNITLRTDSKYNAEIGSGSINGNPIKLMFPLTFMNRSGQSVGSYAHFFKIQPEEILVLHDELDIPPGAVKFKTGGGHGGHNGLRNIIECLGNNQNFHRLRIGIGKPNSKPEMVNFVLGIPPKSEKELINEAQHEALNCVELIFTESLSKATNRLNAFKVSKK